MADEQTLDNQPEELNPQVDDVSGEADGRVGELENQLAEAKEQLLRAAADVQNARRRAEQDVEKAHKFALERFANDLLPVVDSLERGLELSNADDESIKPMREGMQLTLKMFLDTLERFQVQQLNPVGEPFNPEHHQARVMEVSATMEPGSVLKVFQKGFTLSGRLLRPAMVVVSKAPADAPPSIDEQA